INTLSGELDRNVLYNSARQSGEAFAGVALLPIVPTYLKAPVIALGLVGLLIAQRRRHGTVVLLAVWALLNELAALPYLFGLPGTGIIDSAVAPLPLYLTVAPLAGYAVAAILPLEPAERAGLAWLAALPDRWRRIGEPVVLASALGLIATVSAWG